MRKRLLSFALALAVCLSLTAPALASKIVSSGECGDNLTWTLDSEGTLTISGTGRMRDFLNAPWVEEKVSDRIYSVVVEDGVTSISANAFHLCSKMARIDIPGTVTEIAGQPFNSNSMVEFHVNSANSVYRSLEGVLYTADMTTLIKYPARKTDSVYTIPEGVTTIERDAFSYSDNLIKVIIPDSVTEIGMMAFYWCRSLSSVRLPCNLVSIETNMFLWCTNLKDIIIPDSVTEIGTAAFSGCTNLKDIIIPDSVTEIGSGAFSGCTNLKDITIPNSVTKIGVGAFGRCGLTNITIPASVTDIENDAFGGCSNLPEIKVDPANTYFESKDGLLYSTGRDETFPGIIRLISYPAGKKDPVFVVPEGVLQFASFTACNNLVHITLPFGPEYANVFATDCKNLKSITIPVSIQSIQAPPPHETQPRETLFPGCDNISDIYYPGTEAQWNAIKKSPEYIFDGLTIHYNSTGPNSQSVTSPAAPAPAFTDVPDDAYYAAPVAWAVENEITTGTSDTAFSPKQDCTNAQILTFLWRACGKPEPTIDNPFTNKISDTYLQAAVWAYEKGMVSGDTFDASELCTRAMAMTYIWQSAGSPAPGEAAAFTDVPADAAYAQAVAWAVEQDVTTGASQTEFSPDGVCSRGQIVTFLHRALAE